MKVRSFCGLLALCVLVHTQCVRLVVRVHYEGQQLEIQQPAGLTLKGVEMQCSTMRSWRPVPWCTAMASSWNSPWFTLHRPAELSAGRQTPFAFPVHGWGPKARVAVRC